MAPRPSMTFFSITEEHRDMETYGVMLGRHSDRYTHPPVVATGRAQSMGRQIDVYMGLC